MESIYIHGGIALQGQVRVQGSKNAVLPVMAATLLTEGTSTIGNCPRLKDVYHMQTLLESLGCVTARDKEMLKVHAANVSTLRARDGMPEDAVRGMRSSIILLGALLGRLGEVRVEYPGGCVIGERPIDIHIEALKKLNVHFEEKSYGFYAYSEELRGTEVSLPVPSVGATENLILAAVRAKGTTVIRGAAREPEVIVRRRYCRNRKRYTYHTGRGKAYGSGLCDSRRQDCGGHLSVRLYGGRRRSAVKGSAGFADAGDACCCNKNGGCLSGNGGRLVCADGGKTQSLKKTGYGTLSRISDRYAVALSAGTLTCRRGMRRRGKYF